MSTSKDLTDALDALSREARNNPPREVMKPRGPAPAAKSAAPLPGAAGASDNGLSNMTETTYATRQFWPDQSLSTSDGIFLVVIKPVKQITLKNDTGTDVKYSFAEPT